MLGTLRVPKPLSGGRARLQGASGRGSLVLVGVFPEMSREWSTWQATTSRGFGVVEFEDRHVRRERVGKIGNLLEQPKNISSVACGTQVRPDHSSDFGT